MKPIMSKKTRPENAVYPKHFKPWDLEPYYSIHISAMTTEQLDAKADIAEQLAWRDRQLAAALAKVDELTARVAEEDARAADWIESADQRLRETARKLLDVCIEVDGHNVRLNAERKELREENAKLRQELADVQMPGEGESG